MDDVARPDPEVLAEVLEIVGDVLGAPCNADDDFFEIGGRSLTAMQVVPLVEERLGVPVTLEDFLDAPDLATFAATVTDARRAQASTAGPANVR